MDGGVLRNWRLPRPGDLRVNPDTVAATDESSWKHKLDGYHHDIISLITRAIITQTL